jgi:hypothetical protein
LGTVVSGANGLSILAEEDKSPFLLLDIDDDLLLDGFVYFGVPEPLVDNTLAFFRSLASSPSIMESESRFLNNDGLLELAVVVVDSVLAGLAPRKAGRFRASRSEKNQRTNMDTMDCETHRVDIRNTSIGGNRWKVVLSTQFRRVRSYRQIYSSIVAPCMVVKHNGEHTPMTSGGKGTRAIKIGRLNTCTVRTKLNNRGRKRCHNHNGHEQFPRNGYAKILTCGTQEVSRKVVSDEKPSTDVLYCHIRNYQFREECKQKQEVTARHVEVRQQMEQLKHNWKRKFTPATIAKRESKAEGAIAIKKDRRL